jgi:hypothetical protein
MSTPTSISALKAPALTERLYFLDSDELAFLLAETHIENESALKSHLLDIQAKAYIVSFR